MPIVGLHCQISEKNSNTTQKILRPGLTGRWKWLREIYRFFSYTFARIIFMPFQHSFLNKPEIDRKSLKPQNGCVHSFSLKPLVVTAGDPKRKPLVIKGDCGSFGTAFLFTVILARPRAASASLPVIFLLIKSIKNK